MLISEVLKKMKIGEDYLLREEKEFDTLALCGTVLAGRQICTFLDDLRYVDFLSSSVSMLITTAEIATEINTQSYGLMITPKPRTLFFSLHNNLANVTEYVGAETSTVIADSAEVSSLAYVSKNNVWIGENVIIEPFVTIYSNVRIGNNSIIRSGAKVGGEGFEFKHISDGIMPVKHLGGVIIGENVEIQNNSCIDKAVYPWDNTVLADYVKVDNLVHVAHGVKIGKNTMVVANVGIGGRTEIGADSWIGFGATVRNGVMVGDNARVNMGAVVTRRVEDGQEVSGNFAIEHQIFIEHMKSINRNMK